MRYGVSKKGIDFVKRFEGFRNKVYKCQAGMDTIGYGHALKPGENFESISVMDAERLLYDDIGFAISTLNDLVCEDVKLSQNQCDALISFIFNVGVSAFRRSTLRQRLNRGDYEGAGAEFLRWDKIKGISNKGLSIRRKAEMELFFSR